MNANINLTRRCCALLLAALLPAFLIEARGAAAPELAGIWQGKLAVNASTSLTVQFTFTKGANGAYTAVVNSPDNASIKDAAVSGVSWDGSSLKLQVPSLSGSYTGTLKNGRLGGQWTQPGASLPLELAPYQKPVLTAAVAKSIAGSWNGTLTVGPITQHLAFQFKQGSGGSLEGTFGIPDQGVSNVPASDVLFENGELSFKVQVGPQLLNYKGKLAGEQVTGTLKATGLPPDGVPVVLKRGEYKVVAPPLQLSAAAFAALKGKWQGQMDVPLPAAAQGGAAAAPTSVKVTVTVRFETGAKGEYQGYLAVTGAGEDADKAAGFAIAEAQFADGKLAVKVPAAVNAEYSGMLSGSAIDGTWVQTSLGRNIPLKLTRK